MMAKGKWAGNNMMERQKRAGRIRAAQKADGRWATRIAELCFAREIIEPKNLKSEPSLAETTWLPYRYMSAFERTELFSTEYEAVFKRMHAQYKDHVKAALMQPVAHEYAGNARGEMTSLWMARQCADALGVPYSIFIRASMDKAMTRHYGQVPRPNQLCRPWQITAVEETWGMGRQIISLFANDWDPRFFAPSNRDDPPRRAALEALVDLVQHKAPGNRALMLASYIFWRLALSEAEARRRFDEELVDEAVKLGGTPTIVLPAVSDKPYLPHCLGMQLTKPAPQCTSCSFVNACVKLRTIVDKECINLTGTDDPRKARDREQANERKRKQRANEKALLLQIEE